MKHGSEWCLEELSEKEVTTQDSPKECGMPTTLSILMENSTLTVCSTGGALASWYQCDVWSSWRLRSATWVASYVHVTDPQ